MPKQSSHQVLQNSALKYLVLMTKILNHSLIQPSPLLWSITKLPWEIVNKYRPQFWILSSNKQMFLGQGICQNEDPRSAVVVGLPHNSLRIFPQTRVEWISGWRSRLKPRIQDCVWNLTFTTWSGSLRTCEYRCVFRYIRNPRIESSWTRWRRRRSWTC